MMDREDKSLNIVQKLVEVYFVPCDVISEYYYPVQSFLHYKNNRIHEILSTVEYIKRLERFIKILKQMINKTNIVVGRIKTTVVIHWITISNTYPTFHLDSHVIYALRKYFERTKNILMNEPIIRWFNRGSIEHFNKTSEATIKYILMGELV